MTGEQERLHAGMYVTADGAELCVETFGRSTDPTVLLIHGACASMLWWETELCRMLADSGLHVVRYDNRDTGRSTCWPPGAPGYALSDLVADAVAILDALAVDRAHIVGRSMAGVIALALGVDHPSRVRSLTFVSTTSGDDGLPPMSPAFLAAAAATPDTTDEAATVDHVVDLMRAYAGGADDFDEVGMRATAREDVARARCMASTLTNHFAIAFDAPTSGGFADIAVPTLVVHGDRDPVYPLPHAHALASSIRDAQLLVLPRTAHELPRRQWGTFCTAVSAHVASAGARP